MGIKLDFGGRLQLASDVRPVADPWGLGWIWLIRNLACRAYQDLQKKKQAKNPVTVKVLGVMVKAQGVAMLKPLSEAAENDKALAVKEREGFYKAEASRLWEREVDRIEIGAEDLEAVLGGGDADLDDIEALLAGWPQGPKTEDGTPIPWNDRDLRRAALESILSNDELAIPEGLPYAGLALGEAVKLWVLASAGESVAAKRGLIEAAQGNSDVSSGGGTDDTPSSPPPSASS